MVVAVFAVWICGHGVDDVAAVEAPAGGELDSRDNAHARGQS
jgi:hypothetical protein